MVKFETVFNSEMTKTINKMSIKKLAWVYVICSVALLILGLTELFLYLNKAEDASLWLAIFWIVFGILFFPFCKLLTYFFQKKLDKSMPILNDNTKESYEFYEDKIIINTQSGEMYSSHVEASYKYIFKIVENAKTFFLYVNKLQCHVVNKKDLVEGTLEEIIEYFNKNFNFITARSTITYKNKIK